MRPSQTGVGPCLPLPWSGQDRGLCQGRQDCGYGRKSRQTLAPAGGYE